MAIVADASGNGSKAEYPTRNRSRPLGHVQITSLSAAVGLGTVPTGTKYAIIQAETQAVRWRDDGTNPTTAIGERITTTNELYYDGDFSAIKFIEETASAKLNIAYYG